MKTRARSLTTMQHPDERLNDPKLRTWLAKKRWKICAPYAQWDYWHIMQDDTGGIVPLNIKKLIAEFEEYTQSLEP